MRQDLDKARAALKENKIDNAVIKVNEPLPSAETYDWRAT